MHVFSSVYKNIIKPINRLIDYIFAFYVYFSNLSLMIKPKTLEDTLKIKFKLVRNSANFITIQLFQ